MHLKFFGLFNADDSFPFLFGEMMKISILFKDFFFSKDCGKSEMIKNEFKTRGLNWGTFPKQH